jgi:2-iminobutanoate/2-iminopropanoate deaminase
MANVTYIPTPYSYSAAVRAGDFVFLGHRGFGDTFTEQIKGALDGVEKTLGQFDLTLEDLVKINVWLKHVDDLTEMDGYIGERIAAGHYPARMTSTTEFIDADCLVMIEGVAYIG